MSSTAGELIALAGLAALLAIAYRNPRRAVEGGVAIAAALLVIATGVLELDAARRTVLDLAPVVLFLAFILTISEICGRAGLFEALGALIHGDPVRVFTVAFVIAAAVTSTLNLDATVVLFTPVVVAAARRPGYPVSPGGYACLRMANSASLLLPVSNLTNLLAVPHLELSFAGFALAMAPVLTAVLMVEYVGLRLLLRRELAPSGGCPPPPDAVPSTPTSTPTLPIVPAAVVASMLVGFVATSPWHVEPFWVAGIATVTLTAWAARRGLIAVPDAVAAARPEFSLLVLALGLVVAALSVGALGDAVTSLLPAGIGFVDLLVIAAVATALANLLTNLSATLLVVPLVAPLGDVAVLAALIGLNVGSGLTLSGSLANLLWRRTMAACDAPVRLGELHRIGLLLTPVSVTVAVAVLAVTS
ncbi:SLC13 family permease [Nocardioides sp. R-C-SC26]|uniref:SLC13 family permease n=1 Tax=Nocardioides sp. R-C-SC26 TaxID=2870414 RepID=UPI001E4C6CCE|nr:SLC13 family permease [Nocardioides sp. R-C-SC26]